MSFNLDSFKGSLGVAARPNNFYVEIDGIGVGLTALIGSTFNDAKVFCKAAQIPAYSMGVIEVPHVGGRRIKLPGDRTFAEWTATFLGDESMGLHDSFEKWLDAIKNSDYGLAGLAGTDEYYGNVSIYHTDQTGANVAGYKLINAFPTELAQVDLSYDNTDAILEYSVTFQYSYIQDIAV